MICFSTRPADRRSMLSSRAIACAVLLCGGLAGPVVAAPVAAVDAPASSLFPPSTSLLTPAADVSAAGVPVATVGQSTSAASVSLDPIGSTLKAVGQKQAEYALKKLDKDIQDLNKSPNDDAKPLVNLYQGAGGGPAQPIVAPAHPEMHPNVMPMSDAGPGPVMRVTGVYGSNSDMTATLFVGSSREMVALGATLSNGYVVKSINLDNVTVAKGKDVQVLPVTGTLGDVTVPAVPVPVSNDATAKRSFTPMVLSH